jgi:hypothetical protein
LIRLRGNPNGARQRGCASPFAQEGQHSDDPGLSGEILEDWLARAEIGFALAGYLALCVYRRVYIRYPNQVTASI